MTSVFKKLILIAFVFSLNATFAQTFQTTLVPGTGNAMVQSLDGGFVITGWQGPYVLLTKADSTGQVVWTKLFGDLLGMTPHNKGFDIIALSDGGFLLCGNYFPSTVINGAYFIRTDANGDSLWTRYYQSPFLTTDEYYFYEVRQNSFGEFIAAGQIEYDSSLPFDIALMKLDSSGNQIWHKEIDLGKKETFMGLEITDSSYSIIGESYILNSPVHDHFILRTDTSGIMNFSRLYSQSPCCDIISDFIIKDDLNYVIVGFHNDSTTSYIDFFEFNSAGDTIQYNNIPNPLQIPISGFFKHSNGYVLYGYKRTNNLDDAFVIKIDTAGNEMWRKIYGGLQYDNLYDGLLTNNGLFSFTGFSNSFGSATVYLLQTDTLGSIVSNVYSVDGTDIPFELSFNNDSQMDILCDKNLCGPYFIEIYNYLGEKVSLENGYSTNIGSLKNGIYILSLIDRKQMKKYISRLLILTN